ncbi:MAG: hypothetical protein HZA50_07985 [Planctomycetes bacterium]|nr:hypothetical protein [Planctomycetota bacterium]
MEDKYYEIMNDAASAMDAGNLTAALGMLDQLVAAKSYGPLAHLFRAEILLRAGGVAGFMPNGLFSTDLGCKNNG